MFGHFLKSPRHHSSKTNRLGRGWDKQSRRRLLLESLEDRRLLASDFVSLADTERLAEQAIEIWQSTGLSSQQIAALENIEYQVADLGENNLGQYRPGGAGVITIDDNAAGHLWFVDQTPLINEEFHEVDGVLMANAATLATGKIDLLTTLLHEQGHALGIEGVHGIQGDVMSEGLLPGTRALPLDGQADGVIAGSLAELEYLTSIATGSGQSFSNLQPYATTNYVIAVQGLFPSRNLGIEPLLGGVGMIGTNFAPRGYALAHGQILPINQNQSLYSILGTTYGGDGRTTFALPDLRGRVPVGVGQGPGLENYRLGQTGGTEDVTLSTNEIPSHNHAVTGDGDGLPARTDSIGGGQQYDNRQPFLVLTPVVALIGTFPSPNLSADPHFGSVSWFAGNFAPRGYAQADGRLLSISQNTALFSILGTTYGGDGRTTFGLPDLRGRTPIHAGNGPGLSNVRLGQKGGTEYITLTENQLPAHSHGLEGIALSTANTGANEAVENLMPYLALNYNITLFGAYPSRNLDANDPGEPNDVGEGFASGTEVIDESLALPLINALVEEGIDRWEAAGISPEQAAVLQDAELRLLDLASGRLARADPGVITIDRDASGRGWFVDVTPGDDVEFGEVDPRTGELVGTTDASDRHYDLLTTIMHEQGHLLGIEHTFIPGGLMYGGLSIGGRINPDAKLAAMADLHLEVDDDAEAGFLSANPLLSGIGMFAGNFAPRGFALTDGQLFAVSQNDALFSLLGTIYGGDGRTTFALPDFRGRVVVGEGQGPGLNDYRLGARSGAETNRLIVANLPAHTHEVDLPVGRPVANDDTGADLLENTTMGGQVDILANDSDTSGNPTAPVNGSAAFSVDLDQGADGIQTTLTDAQGQWSLDTISGIVTFIPAPGFDGRASINYTITDDTDQSDKAKITFTVRAASGDVVFNLPPDGGTAELSIEGTDIVLRRAGTEIDRAPISTTMRLTINGTDGDDDTLQIDLDGGNPIPEDGLHLNGGVGGNDGLTVVNGGAVDGRYSTDGEQSGNLDVGGREVTFENLEPLDFTGQVINDYVIDVDSTDLIGSTIVVTISEVDDTNTLVSFDATSNLESILFGVVNGMLSINLDATDIDIVNVEGIGSSFAGDIVINGDVLDTINVTQSIDLGGDDLTLSAGAINVFSPVASAGGNVNLTADHIDVQNTINVGGGDVALAPLTPGATIDLGTQVSGGVSKIYWADSDNTNSAVRRADVTGLNSNVETIVSLTGPTPNFQTPSGVGLDPATGQVFFSDEGSDFIARADLDSLNGNVQTLFAAQSVVNDVVVAGGKLYWIDAQTDADHIVRANLDGSNQEFLVTGLDSPQGIAVDVAGGKVYWSDSNDNHIQRADINNGTNSNIEDVVTRGTPDGTGGFLPLNFPEGISLDLVNRKIYYVASTGDAVRRADMDGFNSNIEDIATGLGNPNGVVVDLFGGKVYWSDQNTSEINRADIDVTGGPNQNVETIVTTGTGFPKHLDLLFDLGNFTLTDTELNFITADTLTIGDAASGDITITSQINPANITTFELISGGVIGDTNTTATDIAATNVILDGNVSPGNSPGVLNVDGSFTLANNDTFTVEIGGTAAGDGSGFHDQIAVTGTIGIGTNVILSPSAFGGFTPTLGDTFTIIDNDGTTDAVSGMFAGLPEGGLISDFLGSGLAASISYLGGDGNDVVLTASATIVVTTVTDENDGTFAPGVGSGTSLREAIIEANSNPDATTITFDPALFVGGPDSIDLTLGQLNITGSVNIVGPGANLLTVDAGAVIGTGHRIFNVDDGVAATQTTVSISGLTLMGGDVTESDSGREGGAIRNRENLTIFESTLSGNRAVLGGAIENREGTLNVVNSTLSGNLASNGSAIENVGSSNYSSVVNVSNSTLSGNTMGSAAIHNFAFSGSPSITINNSTIADSNGNAIWNRGSGTPQIVLNNTLLTNPVLQQAGTLTGDFNIFTTAGSTTGGGNDIITAAPLLGPLADNGGPTLTHGLLPGSPAIDAGANEFENVARGSTTSESSAANGRGASLAVDGNFNNTTHTIGATDTNPFVRFDLSSQQSISQIVLHNRGQFNSRLRDITVEILGDNDIVLYTSPLLNPENILGGGVANQGPSTLTVDLVALTGGVIAGHSVRVSRTVDFDLSGTGGVGSIDDQNVLSLSEVEVFAVDQRGAPFNRVVGLKSDIGAFELQSIDFGDAPEDYPTTIADGGASHQAIGPRLGDTRDGEINGQPTPDADGDGSDDDGVLFGGIVPGAMAGINIDLQVTEDALIDAWIDFNGDGDWNDPGEKILSSEPVTEGLQTKNYDVPSDATPGSTVARVRVSRDGGLLPTGPAPNGEVEDYRVTIGATTGAVTINNDRTTRSELTSIEVQFDGLAEVLPTDFELQKSTGEFVTGIAVSTDDSSGSTIATLTFTTDPLGLVITGTNPDMLPTLDNGIYDLRYKPTGETLIDSFFRKYGDTDGDESTNVGLTDFAAFRGAFGSSVGENAFDSGLDANRDGTIGLTDFAAFRSGFGQ